MPIGLPNKVYGLLVTLKWRITGKPFFPLCVKVLLCKQCVVS